MKSLNNDTVRHVHVRAVVAYPAVTVALVVSITFALTPFSPSPATALATTTSATASPTTSATPTLSTSATPTLSTSATSSTTSANPNSNAIPSPWSVGVVEPGAAPVNHHVLARIEGSELQANYLPVDNIVLDAARFQRFRVRFQMHNVGTTPISVTPQLEYRTEGTSGYAVVPEKPLNGIPFHVTREWVASLGLGGGTMQGPLGEGIAVADLRIGEENGFAVNGHRSMGANPDQSVILPSVSYTEQEFTISLTIDAKYLTGYELRITDRGAPLEGTQPAEIRLGAPPAIQLSPGQHQGVAVGAPKPITRTGAVK